MKMQESGDSQAKIKVRLAILPKKKNSENEELATEFAENIFKQFDQTPGYRVEVPYTGEMGILHEILIWVVPSVVFVGETFTTKLVERTADKVADRLGEFTENFRKRRHGKLGTDIKVQSPSRVEVTVSTENPPSPDERG